VGRGVARDDPLEGGLGVLDRVVEQRARHGEIRASDVVERDRREHLHRDRSDVRDVRQLGAGYLLAGMTRRREVPRARM
jgi:hypothetical protein